MVSITVVDDNGKKAQFSSQSKDVSEDVADAYTSKQAQSGQDIYESDFDSDDSDCSVTSGWNSHLHGKLAFFTDKRVGHSTADESGETTWTDERHSSYLDSMEATFVQKMYDKEYCSLDVCGHSSHSSLTLDQECVESQPFFLNTRKPLEQKVAGLLTFRAPTRPLALGPSMLTSPWIQHFKSQTNVSLQNARFQVKDAQPLPSKEVPKKDSVVNFYSSLSEDGSQSSYGSAYKKRDFASVTQAGEYKKQKCQHFALSHMDILMEQQYNLEEHRKMGENKVSENGQVEPKEHLVSHCEHKEAALSCKCVDFLENSVLKEKQELAMSSTDIEPPPLGVLSRKPDQVAPSSQSVDEEACAKRVSAGLHDDEENAHCAAKAEPECVSNPSGSKTWTWGIQGPRYHVVKQTTAHACNS